MEFALTEEQQELAATVRSLLDKRADSARRRAAASPERATTRRCGRRCASRSASPRSPSPRSTTAPGSRSSSRWSCSRSSAARWPPLPCSASLRHRRGAAGRRLPASTRPPRRHAGWRGPRGSRPATVAALRRWRLGRLAGPRRATPRRCSSWLAGRRTGLFEVDPSTPRRSAGRRLMDQTIRLAASARRLTEAATRIGDDVDRPAPSVHAGRRRRRRRARGRAGRSAPST